MKALEEFIEGVEQATAAVLKAAENVQTLAAQAQKVAKEGDFNSLTRALDKLGDGVALLESVARRVGDLRASGDEYGAKYFEERYLDELATSLRASGMSGFVHGGTVMAFPYVVSIAPHERVLKINGRKTPILRPSVVSRLLVKNQKPRYSTARFLEVLFDAYRVVVGQDQAGRPVTWRRLYQVLTLLPAAQAEYPEAQFISDIYAIDRQGPHTTKDGAVLRLVGSTGAKVKKDLYSFVGPDGELVEYYGLQFEVRAE